MWALHAVPTAAFVADRRTSGPTLVAGGMLLLWALLCAFVAVLARSLKTTALRRQAQTVRLLLRNLAEGVLVADRDGRVALANDAALRLAGASADGLGAAPRFRLADGETPCPPARHPLGARAPRRVGRARGAAPGRSTHPGSGTWVSVTARPLRDERNVVRGGVMVMRDVTAHRKAEETLQRLSSAVEQTADSVCITDAVGSIQYVNPAFAAITGYTRDDAIGRSPPVPRRPPPRRRGRSRHLEGRARGQGLPRHAREPAPVRRGLLGRAHRHADEGRVRPRHARRRRVEGHDAAPPPRGEGGRDAIRREGAAPALPARTAHRAGARHRRRGAARRRDVRRLLRLHAGARRRARRSPSATSAATGSDRRW